MIRFPDASRKKRKTEEAAAVSATRVRSIRHFNRTRNACDDRPFYSARPSTFRARTPVPVYRDRHVRHNRRRPCKSSPLRAPTIPRSPRTHS